MAWYDFIPGAKYVVNAASAAFGKSANDTGQKIGQTYDDLTGRSAVLEQERANRENVAMQERINMMNIENAKAMNELNRKWALEDWDKQNAYNSPQQYMNRLRQGGLNPNLIYGTGAQGTAAMVRSTNANMPEARAARIDPVQPSIGFVLPLVQMFLSVMKTNADADKAKSIRDLNIFDLGMRNDLRDVTKSTARAKLAYLDQLVNIKTAESINAHEYYTNRAKNVGLVGQLTSRQIEIAIKNIQLMNIDKDIKNEILNNKALLNRLLTNDVKLAEMLITPHDKGLLGLAGRLLESYVRKSK